MSGLFRTPKTTSRSTLSGEQQSLLGPLAQYAYAGLGQTPAGFDQLSRQLLRSGSAQSQRMAQTIFSDALLGPSLRAYDQQIAPRINETFAGLGGTLSTRRSQQLATTLEGITSNAQAQLAGLLPQIEAFPLQQTLAQIQGLGGLQTIKDNGYNNALRYALQPTQQAVQQQGGPGWGLLGSALGLASFGLAGGLFDSGGATGALSQPSAFTGYAQDPYYGSVLTGANRPR